MHADQEHSRSPEGYRAEINAVIERALSGLALDDKAAILGGQDEWSLPAMPQVGLDSVVMSDGPIGVRGVRWTPEDPSIALPSPTALAATWDPSIARRAGRVLAREAHVKGVHVVLGPTINLHRSPLGGRHFECYSEDPLLTARIAVGYVQGVQSGGVATTPKHFVANEAETERFTVDNIVSERALRELYLVPFEAVAKGGAWGLMSAYNAVNGVTMTENAAMQRGILRDEWGFDGFVVSDWLAARDTVGAIVGGMDVAMPGPATVFGSRLAAAVRAGDVDEALVDEAVRRVLLLAARVGRLKGVERNEDLGADFEDADDVARLIATRGTVLLQNRGDLLPLQSANLSRIAVVGSAAAHPRIQGGGAAQVFAEHTISPLDGLRAAAEPQTEIIYAVGAAVTDGFEVAGDGFELRAIVRNAEDEVLSDVALASGEIQWAGSDFPAGARYEDIHSIEIVGTFTPAQGGTHDFGTRAIGSMRLRVNDEVLFVGNQDAEGTGDPLEAFFTRPVSRGSVDLIAGTAVPISLLYVVPKLTEGQNQAVVVSLAHREPGPDAEALLAEASVLASSADVAVVVVATSETLESEGSDRRDLHLPGRQDELVRRVAAANPRTVVIVNCGAPVEMPWKDDVSAILLTWFPGQEAGRALADVLLGLAEPGGRMPTSWPTRLEDTQVRAVEPQDGTLAYDEEVFIGYRAWERSGIRPAFWFGQGLGYTQWRYVSMDIAKPGADAAPEMELRVTATLQNIGDRQGREIVQLYVAPTDSGNEGPSQWLAGFASVEADAGETMSVTIDVPTRAFQSWSSGARSWETRAGTYELRAARGVGDVRLASSLTIVAR